MSCLNWVLERPLKGVDILDDIPILIIYVYQLHV